MVFDRELSAHVDCDSPREDTIEGISQLHMTSLLHLWCLLPHKIMTQVPQQMQMVHKDPRYRDTGKGLYKYKMPRWLLLSPLTLGLTYMCILNRFLTFLTP